MLNFIYQNIMWFWLGIMILCIGIEAATFNLTTIWAAASALIMIFLSKTHMGLKWQILIFLIMTIIFIFISRPIVMKKLKLGKNVTNVNALEGQEVLVTKTIEKFSKGEAKAKNGVLWTVTSADSETISEGTVCIVEKVDGNTLIIRQK